MFEAKEESVGIAISVPGQSSFSSRTLYIDESVSTVDGIFLKTVSALTAVCGGGTGGGAGLRGGRSFFAGTRRRLRERRRLRRTKLREFFFPKSD